VYSPLLNTQVVPGDNAEGFIDGRVEDYMVRDLFKADCLMPLCKGEGGGRGDGAGHGLSSMISTQTMGSMASRRLLDTHSSRR